MPGFKCCSHSSSETSFPYLFPVGAGKAETAAGGHKRPHLLQREMLSMRPGDSHSPAVCADPTAVFSGSSRVGNTPPFQDHLALDNSPVSRLGREEDSKSDKSNQPGAKKPARLSCHEETIRQAVLDGAKKISYRLEAL